MRRTLFKALVACATLILRAAYGLCSLTAPRKRIVCISRQSNVTPADFSLIRSYVEEHMPEWEVVVLAHTLDNPLAYVPHMFRQVRYIATSRAVVLDSYCIAVSLLAPHIKAPVIQMWHAMGNMKRFGYTALGEDEGRSPEVARIMHMHEGYDSILASSLSFAKDIAGGFDADPSLVYEAPLPRTDLLLDAEVRDRMREKIHAALPQTAHKQNIVYCPTFRKAPPPNEKAALEALLSCIDFDSYNFIYKKHPVSTLVLDDPRVIEDYPCDLDMLYVADVVVSDYSTVIYEAGLLGVPVYLFAYDWDTYARKRSLYIDFERDVPALFTDDARELVDAIEHGDFDARAYQAFIERNITLPKEQTCTQRVVEHIFDLIRITG